MTLMPQGLSIRLTLGVLLQTGTSGALIWWGRVSQPTPLNATCISLRSESDRSDSRLRCLGCCPAKSNHQAPHAAFFFVLPHGSWSAELPPPE